MIFFITGATAGFGAEMVRRFAAAGHQVVASARREPLLRALRDECGDRVHILPLDVCDSQAVSMAVAGLPKAFSAIDVLVNNAGLALGMDLAQEAALSDWQTMVDTNITGVLNCTHAILPGMVTRGRGHVVNIGSVAGEFPYPRGNVYGATKAFVHQFSLNLKADLLGTPVRVTNIEPGMCGGTEFSAVRFKGDRARADAVYSGVKALSSQDIADAVEWVVTRPAHVNINEISLMPIQQAFSPFAIDRKN